MYQRTLLFVLLIPFLIQGQQQLKGKFLPAEEFDWVLVYKVTPTHSNYVGDARISEKGEFEFIMDSIQTSGIYRLVYAVPQEEYNFDIIYNGKEDIEFVFNIESGIEYKTSTENKLMVSYTNSMSMITQSIGKFYREQSKDTTALLSIFNTQRETQEEFEKISEGAIASHFVKANRPYIPETFEDIDTYIKNIRIHYFDNVNFNDEVLQSSNFFVERTLNFVFGMVSKEGDQIAHYKKNIDDVAKAIEQANLETKKMLLHILWQQLSEANYEEVANYLSDEFLIPVASQLNEKDLINELRRYKNVSFGQVAPNFKIDLLKDDKNISTSMHDLEGAEHYIVVFWSSSCSHCLEELPQLNDYIKDLDAGKLKVIAFGLEDDEYRWKSETYNYPEFIHVVGLDKWENTVGNAYNISETPTYFVLDKDKKIVSKPEDFNALKKVLTVQK